MKTKRFGIGFRFSLTVGIILFFFCASFSVVLYYYLRAQVIKEAENNTLIIMTHVKALGSYVKDTLRPKMFDILSETKSEDEFILEAMSTTHINLQVMKRFKRDLPQYIYKRVSDRPMNHENLADDFHLNMMQDFEKNKGMASWQGIVKTSGGEHLVRVRPVFSEQSCLKCHGSPHEVPRSILVKYGKFGKFGWEKNKIVGVESISIPLSFALSHAKKLAVDTFLFGISTLGLLFIALYGIFRLLVTHPLNELSHMFRRIADGTEPLGKDIPNTRRDEIGDLTESFNVLAKHLLEAQNRLKKAAKLERQMMETEKLAALGQLSAGVAHEINNPLGGIKLCFDNLMHTKMSEYTKTQHIETINSGFERIQNIVGHLLDFSKNSSLSTAPSSINNIIENVLKLSEYTVKQKGIALVKELQAGVPDLMVDSNKLEQVFLNLIINAVQAMESGGALKIRTRHKNGWCYISVTDTGSGIPGDIMNKIFDPFFTTKGIGEGTGLGLTVSKAIIEQHKGSIEVDASVSGTTFIVRLPVAAQ